jgi:hypothetical protein
MKSKIKMIIAIGLLAAFVAGCGGTTTLTPTPTQPRQISSVVITETPQPPTATAAAPTVTPLPTLPLTSTVITATPPQAVAKVATPRPAATRTPTKRAVAPSATKMPLKFGTPILLEPIWTDDRHDERKQPAGALTFKWKGQTGMAGDECYLVPVTFSAWDPSAGASPRQDSFLWGCNGKTTITSQDGSEDPPLTLYQPNRGGPTYASLLIDVADIRVTWTVTIVKNLGQCTDDFHCKTVPISPPGSAYFILRGSG